MSNGTQRLAADCIICMYIKIHMVGIRSNALIALENFRNLESRVVGDASASGI